MKTLNMQQKTTTKTGKIGDPKAIKEKVLLNECDKLLSRFG